MKKLLYISFFFGLVACGVERSPETLNIQPPARINADDPVLIGKTGKDDKVVATTNGIPIPESRLKWGLKNPPFDTKPDKKDVLNALIIEELLFEKALKSGVYNPEDPEIKNSYIQALVSRFLAKRFEEDFPPSKIPLKLLKDLYNIPMIHAKYDHADIYRFYDIHWICCLHPGCGAEDCFNMGERTMQEVYKDMLSEAPISKEEIHDIVLSFKSSIAPKIGVQNLFFVYYWDKHQQRGVRIFDENVVNAVIHLKVGEFSKPVKSAFGWHILYLWKHEPEIHKSFEDPEVQEDLRHFFYKKFQKGEFNKFMFEFLPWKEFGFLRKTLRPTINSGKPVYQNPARLYRIHIFDDAIQSVTSEASGLFDMEGQL